MNRICPSEEVLSEYLAGILSPEEKAMVEKHLARCKTCRLLLAEAHDIISKPDLTETMQKLRTWFKKNLWLTGSILFFTLSFVFQKYFLQLLLASFLMGGKWILDSKSAKMLIMIHEAWKSSDKARHTKPFSHTRDKE